MTTTSERRAELEEYVQSKLREMLEENLPTIRARLREATQSKSRRTAADAQRLLDRLDADYGPEPQHAQS
jgi:hypothetical protein